MNRAIKKTLNVEDMRNVQPYASECFKVKKMVNTTKFKVGQYLTENQLNTFCDMPDWTVNVTEFKR